VIIELDQAAEPARTGCDPDEDEQRPGLEGPPLRGPVLLDGDGFQRLVAEQFPHLGAEQDPHVREPADLVDEVPGHALAQIVLADDEGDPLGVPGEEDRGLPRRVAAADDGHRVTAAEQGLCLRRGVVDAHLLEVLHARHVEPAVPAPVAMTTEAAVTEVPSSSPTVYWP
jgi:hypothetical protein